MQWREQGHAHESHSQHTVFNQSWKLASDKRKSWKIKLNMENVKTRHNLEQDSSAKISKRLV